jgi:hypothetical protein
VPPPIAKDKAGVLVVPLPLPTTKSTSQEGASAIGIEPGEWFHL